MSVINVIKKKIMIKKLEDQTACLQGGKAWQPNLTAEELQEVVADT